MGTRFWLLRFVVALAVASAVLVGAELLKGRPLAQAAVHALVWGPVTAAVYVAVAFHRSRRCAVRKDLQGGA
jgi:hypothetical protein